MYHPRRMFTALLFFALLLLLAVSAPAAVAEAAEALDPGEASVSADVAPANGDALLEQYVGSLFGMNPDRPLLRRAVTPTGVNKVLYDRLAAWIKDVASGSVTETEVTLNLSLSDLGLRKAVWYASDLGVSSIVSNNVITDESIAAVQQLIGYDIGLVINCLCADHPYELYWFDITRGYQYTYPGQVKYQNGAYYYTFENCTMRFSFAVSQDFAKTGYDENGQSIYYYYRTNPSLALTAVQAAERARQIVSQNASQSNYGKLNAYLQEICDLTTYNHDAWNNGQAQWPYGNPWQLVWVFDGDPNTKVVCEGYAKAFQYLCDLSSFKGDVSCVTVSGTESSGDSFGRHAWNIVHMNNDLNYLVDCTICDSASLPEGDWLFMAGYSSNPSTDRYVYRCRNTNFTYVYDSSMFSIYDAATLRLSASPFNPAPVGVAINSTNFPDANFRAYVAEELDRDGDRALSSEEIRRTTYISVDNKNISSLKGIEFLTALDTLFCYENNLTSLNLSGNKLLTSLYCDDNQLTSLNVSGNTELCDLSCVGNQLTSLNVRQNLALEYLNCSENKLTSLDVTRNKSLQYLYCEYNQLTSLNVLQNTRLWYLYCNKNKLKSLDVSANTDLTKLGCYGNQLTALNVQRNTELEELSCQNNQLTALNVRRNPRLRRLYCGGNQLTALDIANCPKLVEAAEKSDFDPNYNIYLNYDSQITPVLYDNILRLPADLRQIEAYAFDGVAADVIEVPAGCSLIFDYAFDNCPNLKEVRFDADCSADIHSKAFGSARPIIVTASPDIQAWAEENGLTWVLQ